MSEFCCNNSVKKEILVHLMVAACFWLLEDYMYLLNMNCSEVGNIQQLTPEYTV